MTKKVKASKKVSAVTDPEQRQKLRQKQNKQAQKIRHYYFRTFYYSFAITFIIAGLAAVMLFVYGQDKNFFGSADKQYDQALQYIENAQTDKAIAALEECLELDPDYSKARLMLIEQLLQKGDAVTAEKLTDEGIERHPRNEKFYKLKISLLTRQNKIQQAMEFIDSVASNYIVIKLTEVRPSNIITTPDPGTYDSALQIRFNAQANTDIYYTLDGSAPTLQSLRYSADNPITVEKGTATVRAFAINSDGLISDEYSATYRIYSDYTPYTFVDAKIEQIVRKTLGKSTGTIYYKDLDKIKKLSNEETADVSYSGQVTSLADLLEMQNLTEIRLDNEPAIADYTPLIQLKLLKNLSLSGNNIDDSMAKPIFSVQWLSTLDLSNNLISDITPVKGLTLLRQLNLAGNAVKDDVIHSLGGLTSLKTLDLSRNLISDISPLSSLTLLTSLNLSSNIITDISPLAGMSMLTELDISYNGILQLDAISRLTNIQTLNISDNPEIVTLSALSEYTRLTNLKISGTAVTTIDEISTMTSLITFDCSRTAITDLSVVVRTNIKNLTASQCGLTSAFSLMGAPELEVLDLSVNAISDATPLTVLPNLKILNIASNPVVNVSMLAQCPKLESVTLTNVPMQSTDIWALQMKNITIIN